MPIGILVVIAVVLLLVGGGLGLMALDRRVNAKRRDYEGEDDYSSLG